MKLSNGFNKKQKEEIREIVKSEIKEAIRKNTKPEINVKKEVVGAIYSILNEKNEDLIKNLLEIGDKIEQEETEKSIFASGMKGLLYVVCGIAWILFAGMVFGTIYLFWYKKEPIINLEQGIVFALLYLSTGLILFIFHNSIKKMNKSDLYNSFMFIITMIAFIITVWTVIS